mgnify:CR=1 FL=1
MIDGIYSKNHNRACCSHKMIASILSKFRKGTGGYATRRNSRLLFSIGTSVLAKFIAIGSTLITIPLTLNYLGVESFGVWMVISGVVGFMAFSDLGIGMGLQNALSKACGLDDLISPKYYIANAYLILIGLSSLLVLLLFALFAVLPVEELFKIVDQSRLSDAVKALKYSVLAFLLGIPIALIQRILGGLQKTYVANNVVLLGSLLSLLAILLAVYFDLGLVGLSVLFVLSPIATLLLYSLYFFYKNPEYRPKISNLSRKHISPIVSAGGWTVFVQIIYTAKMNIPTMSISASLGLLAVAEYSVAQKLTGLAATMIGMALQPLWVVYGEAYHRGDREWVESTLKKSLKLVILLTVLAAIAFQFVGQPLIALWLGGEVLPSKILIGCFSLWMIASTINICFAMLLNGTGNFRNQAIFSCACVGLALVLISVFSSEVGTGGVIFIVFFVAELICIPMYYFESKRVLLGLNDGNK